MLVRSTGVPTYFATDAAYHYNKLIERGFDRVINVLGADHQGHVAHMESLVRALGLPPDRLSTIVHQMVTLKRGSEVVRASKRTGRHRDPQGAGGRGGRRRLPGSYSCPAPPRARWSST